MMMQREVGRDFLTDGRTNWLEIIGRLKRRHEPGTCRRRAHSLFPTSRAGAAVGVPRPDGSILVPGDKGNSPVRRELGPALQSASGAHGARAGPRLRQRREPARGAIGGAREGDRGQAGARRRPFTPHTAAADRNAGARGARRYGRTADRAVGGSPAHRLAAAPAWYRRRASTCGSLRSGSSLRC